MKHYRIVKKSTHILIAISTIAVFFNATLLAAGIISISQPQKAKAACDPNTPPASATFTSAEGDRITTLGTINVSLIKNVTDDIRYRIEVTSMDPEYPLNFTSDQNIIMAGGILEPVPSANNVSLPIPYSLTTKSEGIYFKVIFENLTDTSCSVYNDAGARDMSFEFFPPPKLGSSIDLTADPTTIALKNEAGVTNPDPRTTIQMRFHGHIDDHYNIYITDCSGTPWEKSINNNIIVDPYPDPPDYATYDWAPEELTCGSHTVTVKTFNAAGEETDHNSITINMTGYTGPGGSVSDSNIDTPDKLDSPFKTFLTSAFSLPKGSIKGLGDLAAVLIKIIEYLLGVLAFFGLAVSGIQYITSGGDPAKAAKAKKNIMYCAIGITLVVLSLSIQGLVATFWGGAK